jgi:hypothetical protein
MPMSKQLQYELWRECNCKCTFCTLGNDNLHTDEKLKLQSLQTAIDEIREFKPGEHEVLGFIGGDFFQGQLNTEAVYNKFMEMIDVSNDALNKKYIKKIWLNASLLIGDQKHLYETLDRIDDKANVWVLTSYDTFGRFHTEKMFETWEYHLAKLHAEYPEVSINTTSILTEAYINEYLDGKLKFKDFREKYHTTIFLKNPVKPTGLQHLENAEINKVLGPFFPSRKLFLKFLRKFYEQEGIGEYEKLISTDLRAEEVRKNYNLETKRNRKFIRNKETLHESEEDEPFTDLPCGHNDIYASYSDSPACMLCDKKMIQEMYI